LSHLCLSKTRKDLSRQELYCSPNSSFDAHSSRRISQCSTLDLPFTGRSPTRDQVIVFDETALRRTLASYLEYYHRIEDAFVARDGSGLIQPVPERLAGAAPGSASRHRSSGVRASGRWTTPPIRTTRRLRQPRESPATTRKCRISSRLNWPARLL
jgi:hypothetical protein